MTNEYTPTSEHIRQQYARQENYDEFYEGDVFFTPDGQASAAGFDRWLEGVQKKAAYDAIINASKNTGETSVAAWLAFHAGLYH